jgi:hypothetical protein
MAALISVPPNVEARLQDQLAPLLGSCCPDISVDIISDWVHRWPAERIQGARFTPNPNA